MTSACPICDDTAVGRVPFDIQPTDNLEIYRCTSCELEFLSSWNNVELVKSLYANNNYVFKHNVDQTGELPLKFDEYEERVEWVKPFLDKTKSLLEIGCGEGKFLKMVQPQLSVVEGIELAEEHVSALGKQGIKCYDFFVGEKPPPREYDIVCLFAALEHIPDVGRFLEQLKGFIKSDSQIFIEVPNLLDPLVSTFDLPEFRSFYYRSIHLYYFTPKSIKKLLRKHGYDCEIKTSQQASITNHFHWMYERSGQRNGNYMASPILPVRLLESSKINRIFDAVDTEYRKLLEKEQIGDLLDVRAWLSGAGAREEKN